MTISDDPRYQAALDDVTGEERRNRRRTLVPTLAWIVIAVVIPLVVWGVFATYFVLTGFIFIVTRTRGRRLVLWLRPFHKEESHPHTFGRALFGACANLGLPVTIQDSTFHRSIIWAFSRTFAWMLPAFWLVIAPFALVAFLPDAWFSRFLDSSDSMKLLLIAAWLIACAAGFCLLVARAGFTRLRDATAIQNAASLLSRLRQGKGWLSGVVLLQCGDSRWQDVVTLAMKAADVVVLDVSHLSDNVIWELREALRIVGPESMILACHAPGNQLFPQALEDRLRELAGQSIMQCERCVYPASQQAKSLRASIKRCLAANRFRPREKGPAPRKIYEGALALAKAKFHKQYGDQYGATNDAFFDFRAAELALDSAFVSGAPLDIDQLCREAADVHREVPRPVVEEFVDSIRAEC